MLSIWPNAPDRGADPIAAEWVHEQVLVWTGRRVPEAATAVGNADGERPKLGAQEVRLCQEEIEAGLQEQVQGPEGVLGIARVMMLPDI